MKVSVSLPDEDVEFLDRYAKSSGCGSRSAVVRQAIRLLRTADLGGAYAAAWDDWQTTEAILWEDVTGDGVRSGELWSDAPT